MNERKHNILECSALEEKRKEHLNTKYRKKKPTFVLTCLKFFELISNHNSYSRRKLYLF